MLLTAYDYVFLVLWEIYAGMTAPISAKPKRN